MLLTEQQSKHSGSYKCVMDEENATLDFTAVFEAALQGNTELLETFWRSRPGSLCARDESGATPLHYATSAGIPPVIQFLAHATGPEALNAQDFEGKTALHWAVEKNQLEVCGTLLELGADPNVLDAALMSPLHLAVSLRHHNLVNRLLSHRNTDANLEGELGNTPVMLACSMDNCEALSSLFKHDAALCKQNKLGHYAIHAAAFAGARKAMELVLRQGERLGYTIEAQINYLDKSNNSPLHLAVHGGNIDVIKFCIAKGARIDLRQCDKSTALHFACTQGAKEAVELMLASYGKVEDIINITDGANQTPLHRTMIFDYAELAALLISKGADVNRVDCKGHSALLLATSCSAWRCVALLLSRGADMKMKDRFGRNFLHLVVLQPKGLKNLSEDVLQLDNVRMLLADEDAEGCTPLHYACRLGTLDSVKSMLGLDASVCHKSRDKKSALHFAAQYGRINTCHRLLEGMMDSRLLNEGDQKGLTPLHLASRGGHAKVVELLLRKGALFHSDYTGWTCLHHAAAEGYTKTMNLLLGANLKLLDKPDEDGNTALHVAAKEGHASAVKLLLNRGAKVTFTNNDATFFHEALKYGRKEVVNAVIECERSEEALKTYNPRSSNRCVILEMIELLPESFKYLLDQCIKESEDDVNSSEYKITYNFSWLQLPIKMFKKLQKDEGNTVQPLAALNAMVQYNRIELLTHPVCKKYLEMKWNAYGSKAHILNLTIYSLGLLPLSHVIVTLRPACNITANGTTLHMESNSLEKQSYILTVCMFLVLAMNLYTMVKELVQVLQQRLSYFRDVSNSLDWGAAVSSLIFVIPLLMNLPTSWSWQAGAWAVFFSWVNFLLYLQRFEHFGIYVVMFGEIMSTLIRIIMLFFFLLLAFALAFYSLMLGQDNFNRLDLSVMQTFIMMVGELNYRENFLEPYLSGNLCFPFLTYAILVWFILLMPILLMNLLIGLAVGDIAEVQRNAALKRIAMQIELHTSLEEKLPYWFMKRVDHEALTLYPNRICGKKTSLLNLLSDKGPPKARARLSSSTEQLTPLEHEVQKQKHRLKEISTILEKQHNLLKLVIQKMEITSEAEEHDGPQLSPVPPPAAQLACARSRWVPLVKAVTRKK
ncbi:transient receptor potential cation channel subfamily A member 1b isoform X1 [Paramormyrops kingsleyae]|uniref:Transient receptor potential cation channel, subfamily A, member 1b n=1 Tax=Paramormyrops kingsleyae TaxID=1676925 RepID=A0A3B3RYJ4_9TELE|nr:transient receptor potential cation channel subfamily A member 1 isoform X1 [Paramormyrops kingsleyae]